LHYSIAPPILVGRLRTTRDDSDRVRGPLSPGHSLSVINRAGLAALADRLSQSRSQHGGRSPLITRILLSIPARPDCFTHVVALTNPPYSDTHYPPRRAEQSHHTQSPIPTLPFSFLPFRYVIRAKRARDEKKEARARPGVPGRFFTNSLSVFAKAYRRLTTRRFAASPTSPTLSQHSKTRRRSYSRPLFANLATTKRGCVVATSPSPSQTTAGLSAKCTDPGPGQTFDTHRNGNEHEPTLGL
jgi:hypothetical protein